MRSASVLRRYTKTQMTSVRIRGDGVAARCCAHLLSQAGHSVSLDLTARPRLPAILLSESAQHLITSIFGRDNLFHHLPSIDKRIVAWGPGALKTLAHSAVVISEETLLARLGAAQSGPGGDAAWTIVASRPLPGGTTEHRFGSRIACAMPVELRPDAEPAACWIESLSQGWLFLITCAPQSGWLLAVGHDPESLLAQGTLIPDRIAEAAPPSSSFPASPRLAGPLGGPGWIACGSAAMAFDPLCGDGTAHAVREAILASAVIRAADRGDNPASLLAHYHARLTGAFQRHLIHCLEYYRSGAASAWWTAEADSTARGIEWCARQLGAAPQFRYRLNGLELEMA